MNHSIRWVMLHLVFVFTLITLPACETLPRNSTSTPLPATESVAARNIQQLQQALPIYQAAANHPWPRIPTSAGQLKLGRTSPVVLLLADRLKATGDLSSSYFTTDLFDATVLQAVQRFQLRHGLKADGLIGQETRQALNVTPQERIHQIQINMQRWATLSNQLNQRFIMVNIPDFKLAVYEHGKEVLSMKTIIGRPTRPTPELNSTVKRVIFNPYWNVPKLIAQNDILPKMQEDPNYLQTMHIKIINRTSDHAVPVEEDDVDWEAAQTDGFKYHFRQDPGKDNALGLVKFEFLNSKNIYLHDTPTKNLFNADIRDFSSGCIRLEKPFALVSYLMRTDPDWSQAREQSILASGKTESIRASQPTPIIVTYITAWVDNRGEINFRSDIYGKDQ